MRHKSGLTPVEVPLRAALKRALLGLFAASRAIWRIYRGLPGLLQWLVAIPLACGAALSLTAGNMGLAVMGGAVAFYS